ncbi:MAG: hypothetical protein KJ710_03580 [Candidatus Omnitrophica bacterium]|nr:hypothetical protein [Candidatus Omnitrophota bacterium]MBU1923332.1 hypothetical protein [Candidatus Omnitrophota bacterium]
MIKILSCPVLIAVHFLGIAVGSIMFLKPEAVIEFQRKFYEKINWRIEPISIPKEIRNTKLMGLFMVFLAFLGIIYILNPH